jgi:hypothetical protein
MGWNPIDMFVRSGVIGMRCGMYEAGAESEKMLVVRDTSGTRERARIESRRRPRPLRFGWWCRKRSKSE